MQLSLDAADRLVELVQARRGPVAAEEAARELFALASAPGAIARSLLDDVVRGDTRLAWRGSSVVAAGAGGLELPLEQASFAVLDLETTGLSVSSSRIVEIGCQRVEQLELRASFQTLVDPGVPLPISVTALSGIRPSELRRAPSQELALRRFMAFAGDAALVAHNARFDLGFLDRAVERLTGRRVAAPVVDTLWLARRLLGARTSRVDLATLSRLVGTSVEPCHRALPDARATAEILLVLLGLAQERGAVTVADLLDLAAPRARRLQSRRSLVAAAPSCPGVYVFRGPRDEALYVGRARNLRSRLRSYFTGDRQRPAVEAALAALHRVEWRERGSELEAALEELRLLRELRPPANARGTRPDRHVFLRRRGRSWVCGAEATPFGPLPRGGLARRAARVLEGFEGDELAEALPPLRARLRRLAAALRFEDAARLRDGIEALERVVALLERREHLRLLRVCVLVPDREPGFLRALFVSHGRIAAVRPLPPGGGAALEVEAGLAAAAASPLSSAPHDLDELLVVDGFLRRPPPELRVAPLEARAIVALAKGVALAA